MADPADHDRSRTPAPDASGVQGLVEVMWRLRRECPWDAEQTHHSLVTYLVEEAAEVVDAIEAGGTADLREELGDLLLQVVFHCEIEAQRGGFSLDEVADDIAAKLVRRHPYVFDDADVPDDLLVSWEERKRAEKRRTSSLDGIPGALDTLARAHKVIGRSRQHGRRPAADPRRRRRHRHPDPRPRGPGAAGGHRCRSGDPTGPATARARDP